MQHAGNNVQRRASPSAKFSRSAPYSGVNCEIMPYLDRVVTACLLHDRTSRQWLPDSEGRIHACCFRRKGACQMHSQWLKASPSCIGIDITTILHLLPLSRQNRKVIMPPKDRHRRATRNTPQRVRFPAIFNNVETTTKLLEAILDLPGGRRSVSRLARTCKAVSQLALNILWRELDSLIPFLGLFPTHLHKKARKPGLGLVSVV
jgi:hypothetical protein